MAKQLLKKSIWKIALTSCVLVFAGCGDGGGSSSGGGGGTTTTATVASIQMSAVPTTVKSDDSTSSTITVTAVSATNSTIANATIAISTDTGLLSSQTITTDSAGKGSVAFSSGIVNKSNRTANITAAAGTASTTLPVQIVGSTVTATSTTTSLPSSGGATATLTIAATDAGGNPIIGTAVTLSQTAGTGAISLSATSGTTDSNGEVVVTVTGTTAGAATLTVAAAGATNTVTYTVSAPGATFGFSQTNNGGTITTLSGSKTSAMQIGDNLVITADTASSTAVYFVTTIGTWVGGTTSIAVTPAGGIASATLNTSNAGVANIMIVDVPSNGALSDTMSVNMTAKTADHIFLRYTPSVISKSVGTTIGYSTLTATVYDINNAPVGNAPVAFSIVGGGTNSGETISPVVAFTAATTTGGLALGEARVTFTAGTNSSSAGGVQIRASVLGTAVATQANGAANATTSSYDAAIVVGGSAGSIAFGQASKIIDNGGTSTTYTMPMSILVADSNGSPLKDAVVNISAWPIAWAGGSNCTPAGYTAVSNGATPPVYTPTNWGFYYNEDINENLFMDQYEDGCRNEVQFLGSSLGEAVKLGLAARAACTNLSGFGAKDGSVTPLNSWGGVVISEKTTDLPGTVTTDENGLAKFGLTYTKSSALWVVTRIRAQTIVQGSPVVGEIYYPLAASTADYDPTATPPKCELPDSPFVE